MAPPAAPPAGIHPTSCCRTPFNSNNELQTITSASQTRSAAAEVQKFCLSLLVTEKLLRRRERREIRSLFSPSNDRRRQLNSPNVLRGKRFKMSQTEASQPSTDKRVLDIQHDRFSSLFSSPGDDCSLKI